MRCLNSGSQRKGKTGLLMILSRGQRKRNSLRRVQKEQLWIFRPWRIICLLSTKIKREPKRFARLSNSTGNGCYMYRSDNIIFSFSSSSHFISLHLTLVTKRSDHEKRHRVVHLEIQYEIDRTRKGNSQHIQSSR